MKIEIELPNPLNWFKTVIVEQDGKFYVRTPIWNALNLVDSSGLTYTWPYSYKYHAVCDTLEQAEALRHWYLNERVSRRRMEKKAQKMRVVK